MGTEVSPDQSSYQYTALRPGQLRLLRIVLKQHDHIGLELNTLSFTKAQAKGYTCLSYVWGPEKHSSRQQIELNGRLIDVRLNLWNFLNFLRLNKNFSRRWFWIDAICIDQSNAAEKSEQVSRMADIYQCADEVLSWLGQGEESYQRQETTGKILRYMDPNYLLGILTLSTPSRSELDFLDRIRKSEYWTRAWIVQELTLARKTTILCNQGSMSAKRLRAVSSMSSAYYWLLPFHYFGSLMDVRMKQHRRSKARSQRLLALLKQHSELKCSQPLDGIYSLLALAQEKTLIPVDYTTTTTGLFRHIMPVYSDSGRMCLCVPDRLSSALHLNSHITHLLTWEMWEASADNEQIRADQEPYFELIFPVPRTRKGRKSNSDAVRPCRCQMRHKIDQNTSNLNLCLRKMCCVGTNSHLAFSLDSKFLLWKGVFYGDGFSYDSTIYFKNPVSVFSTYVESVGIRLHIRLSFGGLFEFISGVNRAPWRDKCHLGSSEIQYLLLGGPSVTPVK